jgi:hypothetical protein
MTVDDLLARLEERRPQLDHRWAVEAIERWLTERDHDRLEELVLRLPASSAASQLREWVDQALDRLLCFDRAGAAERLLGTTGRRRPDRARAARLAGWLACGQEAAVLQDMVADHGGEDGALDVLACLVSEVALRGGTLESSNGAALLQTRLAEQRHPLAPLPWRPRPLEVPAGSVLPRYRRDGGGATSPPFGPSRPGPQLPEFAAPIPPMGASPEADPATLAELNAPLGGFDDTRTVAWVVAFSGPVERMSRALLVTTGAPCLVETRPADVHLESIPPEEAFTLLLGAGVGLIPYDRGVGAAFARLNAWRALRVLAGADSRGPLDLTASEAVIRQCDWFYFDANNEWFYYDWCDLGVAALRPDRASLALVAGTGTD